MARIYLVRHAEAEGNIYRIFQGQQDTLLTETGNVQIRALGLNCGLYDPSAFRPGTSLEGLARDYLGRLAFTDEPRLRVLDAIGGNYPPAFISTSHHDFLRENAQPMYEHLRARGIPARVECYGTEETPEVAHVFHVNIRLPEARRCNDDEATFFRDYI